MPPGSRRRRHQTHHPVPNQRHPLDKPARQTGDRPSRSRANPSRPISRPIGHPMRRPIWLPIQLTPRRPPSRGKTSPVGNPSRRTPHHRGKVRPRPVGSNPNHHPTPQRRRRLRPLLTHPVPGLIHRNLHLRAASLSLASRRNRLKAPRAHSRTHEIANRRLRPTPASRATTQLRSLPVRFRPRNRLPLQTTRKGRSSPAAPVGSAPRASPIR